MAAIAGDVKDLFAFKYKHRDDDFSDQYSRIFMTKAMLGIFYLNYSNLHTTINRISFSNFPFFNISNLTVLRS